MSPSPVPARGVRISSPLVALTGATGFIGRHLLADLRAYGYRVRVLLRHPTEGDPDVDTAVIGDLARPVNLAKAFDGVDAVIHSAGIAHAMSGCSEEDYRTTNTEGTLALAGAAERAGVRRFVFLSSVRAQIGTSANGILDETRPPVPTDAYGRSKLAAEEGLAGLRIDWAALRPVLVYGPGVKGNMRTLLTLARTHYPLPFASFTARRSLLALDNLAAATRTALSAPGPLRRPFLVADDDALTLPEMITAMRAGLGRRPGLLPTPPALFALAAQVAGQGEVVERLAGHLVANTAALRTLGWRPLVGTRNGLGQLAAENAARLQYLATHTNRP